MRSKLVSTVTRVVVSLGALGCIVYFMRDHLGEAVHILNTDFSWKWGLVALIGYQAANMLLALRLRVVLTVQGIFMGVRQIIYLIYIGLFFNLFLPSALGGDVAKGYYIYKSSGNKMASTTCIILDRILGFVVLISLAGLAITVFSREFEDPRVSWIVYIFLVIMCLMVLFLLNEAIAKKFSFLGRFIPSEKWRERLGGFYQTLNSYRGHKSALLRALSLAFAAQAIFYMTYYWCSRSLGADLNPWLFFALVPVISIVSMAPSIGGLGVREAGTIFVFSRFMPTERALALALLLDLLVYGTSIVAGIGYALRGGLKEKNAVMDGGLG